jgi:hypothetical protein
MEYEPLYTSSICTSAYQASSLKSVGNIPEHFLMKLNLIMFGSILQNNQFSYISLIFFLHLNKKQQTEIEFEIHTLPKLSRDV